jgi:hypothetical protein
MCHFVSHGQERLSHTVLDHAHSGQSPPSGKLEDLFDHQGFSCFGTMLGRGRVEDTLDPDPHLGQTIRIGGRTRRPTLDDDGVDVQGGHMVQQVVGPEPQVVALDHW